MFRFTIRDVLWLMVVVAMGTGWAAEHRMRAARHEAEIQKIMEPLAGQTQCIIILSEELRRLGIDPKEVVKKSAAMPKN